MGNDGGSIPTRRELVKEAARNPTTDELKETRHEQQEYHWRTDPISNEPLARPIVSDCTGKLYNKSSILEFLISETDDRRKVEAERLLNGNVKSLRDVLELKFEVEQTPTDTHRGERWICPITNKPLGPGSKAVYLVPCGHVFSASVVKEVTESTCLQCNEPYAPNDIIPIVPADESDIARLSLRIKMLREKGLTHTLKKAPGSGGKKRKKVDVVDEVGKENTTATHAPAAALVLDVKSSHQKKAKQTAGGNISNASTASLTARVLAEQEERNRKRKKVKNEVLESLFTSAEAGRPSGRNDDFMTRGFSIPAGGGGGKGAR